MNKIQQKITGSKYPPFTMDIWTQTPDLESDRWPCQHCHCDVQFAVCHFLIFAQSNQIYQSSWSGGLNHKDSHHCLKIYKQITVAVTSFFTQSFNEMLIFVGERYDFTYVNIMSPGKGCTWYVNLLIYVSRTSHQYD